MDFLPAIIGGLLIGGGAALLYASAGRTAGISGLTYGLLWPAAGGSRVPSALFLAGLFTGAFLATLSVPLAKAGLQSPWTLLLSGLLVGFGTRRGNGCTSGHGVCGLARLSWRSLVAVLVFMAVGALSATLLRGLLP